jgi:hypothetical protein
MLRIMIAVSTQALLMNASRSALIWSLLTVHIPWEKPGYTLSVEPFTSFDDKSADAAIGTIWSSFAPILLDDPISNFDDLNGYALLDLIGGLVEEEPGRRQFVFALCDERMFKLARQRFRHLSGGLRVFSFQSFGVDGPTVVAS